MLRGGSWRYPGSNQGLVTLLVINMDVSRFAGEFLCALAAERASLSFVLSFRVINASTATHRPRSRDHRAHEHP